MVALSALCTRYITMFALCTRYITLYIQEARHLPEGSRVVVILPDSVRNYMTKYLSDEWMIEKGFLSPSEADDMSLQWFVLFICSA